MILTKAHQQLFARRIDERFVSLQDLYDRCQNDRRQSEDRWTTTLQAVPMPADSAVSLLLDGGANYRPNDWSFGQLCKLANVSKETVNRLSPNTAATVLQETLPRLAKPMQVLTSGAAIRSLHGPAYTRLWNVDVLNLVREFATDFTPPQTAIGGGTGLYCGEQDMFVFLIDPTGWCEIEGEAFAPGMFLWNSEVGCRSVGVQTFWFQAVCQNHIVWDAVEVIDFSRKHTANVHDCLREIRRHIETLVEKRDARRDGFARVMAKAFKAKLGDKADDVAKVLAKHGIPRDLAKKALATAERQGRFTIFSLVDALTRHAADIDNAGDRLAASGLVGCGGLTFSLERR